MNKLVLASNNKNKIKEIKAILSDFEIYSLEELGFYDDIEETGSTFFENAMIKAKTACEWTNLPCLADDSGLQVEALDGAPGIYSARYSGSHGNDKANIELLLKNLANFDNRKACFNCTMVLYYPDGKFIVSEGKAWGRILFEPVGKNGFGYDPVFFSDELQKPFAVATADEKNSVSHRYKALCGIKSQLV